MADAIRPEPEPPGPPTAELSLHGVTRVGWRVGNSQGDGSRLASQVPHPAGDSPVRHRQARSALGSAQQNNPVMKVGAVLAADLDVLTAALDEPGADVLHTLHQLGVEAQAAAPTYL